MTGLSRFTDTYGDGAFLRHHGRESARGATGCTTRSRSRRQFALDPAGQVLLFEPGTAEVLEIPCGFERFHDEELVDEADAARTRWPTWKKSPSTTAQIRLGGTR